MKKILFVFPLLLIFVLPCLVPLRSSAAFADDLYDDGYYTAHASQAQNYFEFCYTDEEGKHTLYWDNIVFDISLSDIDIVSYNGDYWIYVSTSSSFIFNRASYDNPTSYRDIETERDFFKLVGGIHVSSYGSVELFKYSSTGSHHIESEPFFTATVSNDNLAHIKTNLFEFAGFAEPELSVSFSPINFTGTISDLLEYQGPSLDGSPISTKLNQIALHINNPTNDNYQYAWFIVPHGESVSFQWDENSNGMDGETGKGFVGNVSFVLLSGEWCYVMNPEHTDFDDYGQWTYMNSSWHRVDAHSSNSLSCQLSQMKLYENTDYDCLVYAIKTTVPGGVSYLNQFQYFSASNPLSDYALDFSEVKLIYSSTFSLSFDTPFDPANNWGRVVPYDSDVNPDQYFNKSSARINPKTGETEYDYNISDYRSSRSYSTSNVSLSTFSGAFGNVFSFLSMFFSYIPVAFQQLYLFGFTALIVIAIIKAVS